MPGLLDLQEIMAGLLARQPGLLGDAAKPPLPADMVREPRQTFTERQPQVDMQPHPMIDPRINQVGRGMVDSMAQPFVNAYDAAQGRLTEDDARDFAMRALVGELVGRAVPMPMPRAVPRQTPAPQVPAWQSFATELEQRAAQRGPMTASERASMQANDLRRGLGVTARTESGQQTDAVIAAIEEALKLRR